MDTQTSAAARQDLEHFIARHPRLFILTGAGCSTESAFLTIAMRPASGSAAHR